MKMKNAYKNAWYCRECDAVHLSPEECEVIRYENEHEKAKVA